MKTQLVQSTIDLRIGETVFVVCENEMQPGLHFNISRSEGLKPIKHTQVKITCHAALEFYPPELGRVALENYVAQKLESSVYASVSVSEWLEVFKLADHTETPLDLLPWAANCRLQLLLAVLEHTAVIILSHNLPVDQPGIFLHRIHRFCSNLNASFQSSFVIVAEDLEPRWAWAVDHILEVEMDGKFRKWSMEI